MHICDIFYSYIGMRAGVMHASVMRAGVRYAGVRHTCVMPNLVRN